MIKTLTTLSALAAIALTAPLAAAPLRIEAPWLRETPPAARTGAGYALIRNPNKQEDRLLGGSTAVADAVEVHSMTMDGGIMRMRPVTGGLAIPAGGSVALRPGGYHLMLTGLKRPLKRGETVELRLRFARAGTVPIRFKVEAIDHGLGGGDGR
jgi:copper(I)-binding protein